MSVPQTVGLAIIARNAEESLAVALDSVRDHVDQVVVVLAGESTDKTREVALRYTSEVYDFEWIDDFSAARNFSFSFLRTDWGFWIDADDIVKGAEKIHEVIERQKADIVAVILPYFYAFDDHGNCTTLLDRKRFVRLAHGWEWKDRIHEDIIEHKGARYARTQDISIWHQHRGYENRQERNIPLLIKSYEEDPNNARHWKYLGYQYFANGDWLEAIRWLGRFAADRRGVPIERWQAMCYCAKALRARGEHEKAIRASQAAMHILPHLNDAYFELGLAYLAMDAYEKTVHWTEIGLQMQTPDTVVIVNPLEMIVQPHATIALALYHLGDLKGAAQQAAQAVTGLPDFAPTADLMKRLLDTQVLGDEFIKTNKKVKAATRLSLYNDVDLKLAPEVRDAVFTPYVNLLTKRGSQPRVIFYAGNQLEPWDPQTASLKGIGGSETALVEIEKRFVAAGWETQVFARPDKEESTTWMDYYRYRPDIKADLLVTHRSPEVLSGDHAAEKVWAWWHDLNYGDKPSEADRCDLYLGVSQWHADYLTRQYPWIADRVGFVPNGIDLDRFQAQLPRQARKVVYSSSPDRGLAALLQLWQRHVIVMDVDPLPELHIYYGWESFDATSHLYPGMSMMKETIQALGDHPSIHWRGRLPQGELAQEFLTAEVWAYPTNFLEVSCITAMEAMAAGLTCVTSECGALPETLGDVGFKVPGPNGGSGYAELWMGVLYASLLKEDVIQAQRNAGRERVKNLTWEKSWEKWKTLLSV
jgi:glycosyltransferase involved in cell wall biosynthesis